MLTLFRPMSELSEQMEKMFTDLSSGFPYPTRKELATEKFWVPAIELSETDQEYLVHAEIPGMKPEDISVEVLGDAILLKGKTREKFQDDGRYIHRSEFRYGEFLRRIPIPGAILAEKARAEFKNGVLELRLPKQEETHRKSVTVTVTGE